MPAGANVWIHDYQLFLLPQLLAGRVPGVKVGLSIHTPFDLGAVSRLPEAAALAAGMSGAGCIGTQTAGDGVALRSFLASSAETLSPRVFTSPVSIDPASIRDLLDDRVTRTLHERERALLGERTLIVTVDRLDYTKGIMERMRAYDAAFARGWLDPDEVRIVQITQPSRVDVAEYRSMRVAVERLAHELHARWPRRDGSSPLEAIIESQDRRRIVSLLASADVCLVTPHRDGMNLVAKEFSILNEAHGGALVITRGAGAAIELGEGSIVIDEASPLVIADGLRTALALAPEVRRRLAAARAAAVTAWTAADWADSFVDQLSRPDDEHPAPRHAAGELPVDPELSSTT